LEAGLAFTLVIGPALRTDFTLAFFAVAFFALTFADAFFAVEPLRSFVSALADVFADDVRLRFGVRVPINVRRSPDGPGGP
jgi:hypothetical protein